MFGKSHEEVLEPCAPDSPPFFPRHPTLTTPSAWESTQTDHITSLVITKIPKGPLSPCSLISNGLCNSTNVTFSFPTLYGGSSAKPSLSPCWSLNDLHHLRRLVETTLPTQDIASPNPLKGWLPVPAGLVRGGCPLLARHCHFQHVPICVSPPRLLHRSHTTKPSPFVTPPCFGHLWTPSHPHSHP